MHEQPKMPISCDIRPVTAQDLAALKTVIDANELFPSQMLDEMVSGYLNHQESQEIWLTGTIDSRALAVAYCAPEKMTEGTWNLYLIAVHPEYQGQGIGTAMIEHVEQILATQGERILLVETSGLDDFAPTRSFYQQRGYEEEARIRDFYQAGEDKIVLRKSLL